MKDEEFAVLCEQARAKEISTNVFFRKTDAMWERLTTYILRRWKSPSWYGREEVKQELMMGVWKAIGDFLPGRNVDIGRYVLWNAVDDAKCRLHKARGANMHRRRDHETSLACHVERTFTAFTRGDEAREVTLEARHSMPPNQEACIAIQAAMAVCERDFERFVVQILAAGGDLVDAAKAVQNVHHMTVKQSAEQVVTAVALLGQRVSSAA
jgi:hypothetical protein